MTLPGIWQLPNADETGTIQNIHTGVNGYLTVNANTAAGSAVVEDGLDPTDSGQQWKRSADDNSGYFTLRNSNSGKFLSLWFSRFLAQESNLILKKKPLAHVKMCCARCSL